jgi:hypothetical protein
MRSLDRCRPSPAMVVASIALLVALGGTSIAAVSALPRGSVGTPQLRNNAVTSVKVKNRSLRAVDFARGQLPAGAQGPEGPQGATGDPGPRGAKGEPGSARAWAHVAADGTVLADANVTRTQKLLVGVYCVFLEPGIADLTTAGATVSPNQGSGVRVYASTAPGGCGPSPAGVQVNVWNGAGVLTDNAFTVVVP